MKQLSEILSDLDRRELCAALNVGEPALSNAVAKGKLPAKWYPVVRNIAEKKGIVLPDAIFNWKVPVEENHTAA